MAARASLGRLGFSLLEVGDDTLHSDRRSEVLSFLSGGALRGDASVDTLVPFRLRLGLLGKGLPDPDLLNTSQLSVSLEALVEDSGLDTMSRKGKSTVGLEPGGENIDGWRVIVAGLISRALAVGLMLGLGSSSELDDEV